MIWKVKPTLDKINQLCEGTMAEALKIILVDVTNESISATMPIHKATIQPMGILHGGASAALAETLGSIASYHCIDDIENFTAVGLNINADHLRPVSSGIITGIVTPIKIGKKIHIWKINIFNKNNQLVCDAKLSVMIIPKSLK